MNSMYKPNVFISWSGAKSRSLASALRGWLPTVLQSAEPWMSDADLGAGRTWENDLRAQLEGCLVGIVCVTQENFHRPWLLFEAGALAKQTGARLIPYLFEVKATDLTGPLTMFQAVPVDELGTKKLVCGINAALGPHAVREDVLETVYRWGWPEFAKILDETRKLSIDADVADPARSVPEMLEEVLSICRRLATNTSPTGLFELVDRLDPETQRALIARLRDTLSANRSTFGQWGS